MKKRSSGATTMALASALRVGVQIAILPLIGRLLGPHAYGLIALVSPFVFFSMMLAESGLGACIVRADKITPDLEGTVFCFSAALGLAFMILFATVAWPLGHVLNEPEFPALLIGMSSILVLAAFNIVPSSLLLRARKYNWIAASDVASSVAGLAGVTVGIGLGWGAWSLVAQQIALWMGKLAVVTIGARVRPRFRFRWSILRDHRRYGSTLTANSIVWFIARNIDNVLIGAFMGADILGFYALAFQIVGIPQTIMSGSTYFVSLSGTSEAKRTGASPIPQFLSIMRGSALMCLPAIVGLAVTADLSVPLLLGNHWGPTSLLIVLLAPLGIGQALSPPLSGTLNGLGLATIGLKLSLVSAGATIAAIIVGVHFGSVAVAIGVGLTGLIFPVLAAITIAKENQLDYKQLFHPLGSPAVASAIMGAGVIAVHHCLPPTFPLLVKFLICVSAGVAFYAGSLALLFKDHLFQDIAAMKAVLRR